MDDTIVAAVPLHHSYGMGCCLMAAISCGATLLVPEGGEPFVFRRRRMLDLLEQEDSPPFPGVPALFRFLAKAPGTAISRDSASASRGRRPAAIDVRRVQACLRRRRPAAHGCTETGLLTMNLTEDPDASASSVGRPIRDVRVAIVDDSGNEVEPGRIGEIVVSSPAMSNGYAGAPEANRLSFRDGSS